MDNEKAYNEALERARRILCNIPEGSASARDIETIFPELRESEDERIRKDIVAAVEMRGDLTQGRKSEIYAYLEKQKAQKSVENPINWTELTWKDINELEEIINHVHYEFRNGISAEGFGKEVLEQFRNMKEDAEVDACEQKSVDDKAFEEWIDGWFKEHKEKAYPQITMDEKEFKNFCRGIRNMYQQKQEWSEEDEKIITRLIGYFESFRIAGVATKWEGLDIQEVITLLKSLRPQPKQEWNEEDEEIFNNIIEKAKGGHWIEVNEITWLINRFKSLRPSWKPSEEQMKALQNAVALAAGNKVLAGLYEQLKAIKED